MKKLVEVCQCVEVIALAVWVGGLASIIAAVIPAAFNSPITVEAAGRLIATASGTFAVTREKE